MLQLLPAIILAAVQAQGTWQPYGGSGSDGGVSNNSGDSSSPSLALDASGLPIVAWQDKTPGNFEIFLRRWNGTDWIGMDGEASVNLSNTTRDSASPSLALDGAGNPVVAWHDLSTGVNEIFVRRWNPATRTWTGMDGSEASVNASANTGDSTMASLALDASGAPWISWQDSLSGNSEIYVKRWDGGTKTWVQVGAASASGGGISMTPATSANSQIALDPAGRPVVSWSENTNPGRILVRRWNGTAWVGVDGSPDGVEIPMGSSGIFARPAMALDAAGQPVIAYRDVEVGSGQADILVRRWNGTAWVGIDGTGTNVNATNTGGTSGFPAIALDGAGRPTVAWQESTGGTNQEIYLRRWTGTTWEELTGSAGGGGISNNPGYSGRPAVKVRPGGSPVVAWWDDSVAPSEVYVLRYDVPLPPDAPLPALAAQYLPDGVTPVATGGTIDRMGAVFTATGVDPNGDAVRLQVEVQPVGQDFSGIPISTGAPGPSGTTVTAPVGILQDDLAFHWQLRIIDAGGLVSPWVSFGQNPEGVADFRTPVDHPAVAVSVEQVQIWDRGIVSTLLIRAAMTDADPGDQVKLEVEVRRVEEAFVGVPTVESAFVASGTPVEITVSKMLDGFYKWRYQTRDSLGKASGWISYGGNSDSEADFAFPPFGSSGHSKCANAAPGAALPLSILAVAVLLVASFRSIR